MNVGHLGYLGKLIRWHLKQMLMTGHVCVRAGLGERGCRGVVGKLDLWPQNLNAINEVRS